MKRNRRGSTVSNLLAGLAVVVILLGTALPVAQTAYQTAPSVNYWKEAKMTLKLYSHYLTLNVDFIYPPETNYSE